MAHPSTEIADGPEIRLRAGTMTLRFSDEDGQTTELTFTRVAALTFTELGACSPDQLDSYDKVTVRTTSPLLDRTVRALPGRAGTLSHYQLFIDDVGCYDVVAGDFRHQP
ncbi:MAG: hypothetical protein AB7S26_35775 [Sandaracinaceae bacterium]